MAFDTHAAVKTLTGAGASEAIAVAVVDVAQSAGAERGRELVTRADLRRLSPHVDLAAVGLETIRHRYPRRAPGPGAPLRHALQLRAGERGAGDAAAGLLRAGEPGLVEAPREGREATRRAGAPPGCRGPQGGRARGAEGGAVPEHGPDGAPADRPGARTAGGPGGDQAAPRGRGAPTLDVLPHVQGDGITAYLSNGGTLEHAQQIAGHASPKTTKLLRPDGGHFHVVRVLAVRRGRPSQSTLCTMLLPPWQEDRTGQLAAMSTTTAM